MNPLTSRACHVVALVVAIALNAAVARAAEKVIATFNPAQGYSSRSGLTIDAEGNLYGIINGGGINNCGSVFELTPGQNGTWTESIIFSFKGCQFPAPIPGGTMVLDKEGNLYGSGQSGTGSSGAIFELKKSSSGAWSEGIIHTFTTSEGSPNGDLTWDDSGNLYGTTSLDSTGFNGEVFELTPQSNSSWKETILFTFPAPDGAGIPCAGVTFDGSGNLYGPTYFGIGGESTYGAIYELSPQSSGPWKFTLIHNFTASDGGSPYSRLVFDSNGNLYGTGLYTDNNPLFGEVFELIPGSDGTWTEKTIHTFASGRDGANPVGAPVIDASGNLYGATTSGGIGCNASLCGVVYKLSPQSGGTWKETIVHPFESAGDGSQPGAGLLLDSSGNLYGTTSHGGSRYGYGTVYEITP
jgi:uncharacterized repeat protein (TIGR03803 family)